MAGEFTSTAPTYLGPRYPRGIKGATERGEETAVRWGHGHEDGRGGDHGPGQVLH